MNSHAGTVTTACVTECPRKASAVSFILVRTAALISSGDFGRLVLAKKSKDNTHKFLHFFLMFNPNRWLSLPIDDLVRPGTSIRAR